MTRARIRVLVTSLPLLTCAFFKLVNNQEKFYRQNKRNERGADKINDPEETKRKL